ncbi:MAG: hypothetical protein CM15mP32_3490 [Flavobacteriaceae bacterium]|nr:MAG: hypothetical protein CM15mP32_3490 [Flavobacteriaceae bacterium]
MWGSGTLLIEVPCRHVTSSQINRKEFALKSGTTRSGLVSEILKGPAQEGKECFVPLVGYDKAPPAVRKALQISKLPIYLTMLAFVEEFFLNPKRTP